MIRTRTTLLSATLALAFAPALLAQEAPPEMTPEQQAMMEAYQKAGAPGPQHAMLAKSAGTYDMQVRSWEQPGSEPSVSSGTATRRMLLDGRVMQEEAKSSMWGQPFTGIGLHGYDNVTGEYWSTWNDSMSTGVMLSRGSCGDDGACTFAGSWHDPLTKKEVTARMTTRWTSPDVEVFEMYGPGPDGKEFRMMEITYTRRP